MKPKAQERSNTDDLFRNRLENIINMQHELVILSEAIDWSFLESKVCGFYSDEGRPGLPVRLIAGIHILKQMFNLSDEAVCFLSIILSVTLTDKEALT